MEIISGYRFKKSSQILPVIVKHDKGMSVYFHLWFRRHNKTTSDNGIFKLYQSLAWKNPKSLSNDEA